MRWFVSIIITSCISIGVAVLLSNLTTLDEKIQQDQIQSIPTKLEHKLNDQNIVDHLIELPMSLDIYRVDWGHSILSIDLQLANEDVHPTLVYKDLTEISHFGLESMDNVKQVLVRVFEKGPLDPNHIQFMLAMDAHRNDWSSVQYESLKQNEISINQFLHSSFSFTTTQKWERFVSENR